MDIAEEAFFAKRRGEEVTAVELFSKALTLELEAANSLTIHIKNEPTRSILFRSSAALAQNANQFELAERLIANGLAGFPPPEIKEELKNLYEDINFMRHLSLKGMSLANDQWIMSIYGNATKYGATAAEQLMTRVDRLSSLFYRTVERLLKLPYRTSGGVSKEIKDDYGLFINAFAARSFAVSFQVGRPDPQLVLLPDMRKKKVIEPAEVVDEILSCFELFEGDNKDELKQKFEEEVYFDNFIGLAKQMAPDGDDIKMVGFNTVRGKQEKPVTLRKSRRKVKKIDDNKDQPSKPKNEISLCGILMHANSPIKGKFGSVKLWSPEGKKAYTIHVPIALMKDVVQPFYEESVAIHCLIIDQKIILEEIAPYK